MAEQYRYAQIEGGPRLAFPIDTPDEVIDRVVRERTAIPRAMKAFGVDQPPAEVPEVSPPMETLSAAVPAPLPEPRTVADVLGQASATAAPPNEPEDPFWAKNFNTPIPPEKQEAFDRWIAEESKRQGRDLRLDLGDYDVQGFWLAGERPDERNHGTDRFKKPNHPTFSNESIYHGQDGFSGGEWGDGTFKPGETNLSVYGPDRLKEYFAEVEPDVRLVNGKSDYGPAESIITLLESGVGPTKGMPEGMRSMLGEYGRGAVEMTPRVPGMVQRAAGNVVGQLEELARNPLTMGRTPEEQAELMRAHGANEETVAALLAHQESLNKAVTSPFEADIDALANIEQRLDRGGHDLAKQGQEAAEATIGKVQPPRQDDLFKALKSENKLRAVGDWFARGAGQQTPILVGIAATGGAGGPTAAVGAGMALETGAIMEDIEAQSGRLTDEDKDIALAMGVAAGWLEATPVGNLLKRAGGKQVVSSFGEFLAGTVKSGFRQGVEEFGTEFAQTFIEQAAVDWTAANRGDLEKIKLTNAEGITETLFEALNAAFLGFGVGAPMGVAGGPSIQPPLTEEEIAKAIEPRETPIGTEVAQADLDRVGKGVSDDMTQARLEQLPEEIASVDPALMEKWARGLPGHSDEQVAERLTEGSEDPKVALDLAARLKAAKERVEPTEAPQEEQAPKTAPEPVEAETAPPVEPEAQEAVEGQETAPEPETNLFGEAEEAGPVEDTGEELPNYANLTLERKRAIEALEAFKAGKSIDEIAAEKDTLDELEAALDNANRRIELSKQRRRAKPDDGKKKFNAEVDQKVRQKNEKIPLGDVLSELEEAESVLDEEFAPFITKEKAERMAAKRTSRDKGAMPLFEDQVDETTPENIIEQQNRQSAKIDALLVGHTAGAKVFREAVKAAVPEGEYNYLLKAASAVKSLSGTSGFEHWRKLAEELYDEKAFGGINEKAKAAEKAASDRFKENAQENLFETRVEAEEAAPTTDEIIDEVFRRPSIDDIDRAKYEENQRYLEKEREAKAPKRADIEVAPDTEERFAKLADEQRGRPESAMLDVTRFYKGGVFNVVAEHGGDLTHRMAEKASFFRGGFGAVKEKVDRLYRFLHNEYGFEKEMEENLKNNGVDRAKFDQLAKKYADEHRKLAVYNDAQRTARDFAVAVGEQRFDDARALISKLKDHIDQGRTHWEEYALQDEGAPAVESKPDSWTDDMWSEYQAGNLTIEEADRLIAARPAMEKEGRAQTAARQAARRDSEAPGPPRSSFDEGSIWTRNSDEVPVKIVGSKVVPSTGKTNYQVEFPDGKRRSIPETVMNKSFTFTEAGAAPTEEAKAKKSKKPRKRRSSVGKKLAKGVEQGDLKAIVRARIIEGDRLWININSPEGKEIRSHIKEGDLGLTWFSYNREESQPIDLFLRDLISENLIPADKYNNPVDFLLDYLKGPYELPPSESAPEPTLTEEEEKEYEEWLEQQETVFGEGPSIDDMWLIDPDTGVIGRILKALKEIGKPRKPLRELTIPEEIKAEDPAIESRYQEAKGLRTPGHLERMKGLLQDAAKIFRRHYLHIDVSKGPQWAMFQDLLRTLEAQEKAAKPIATQRIIEITEGLDGKGLDLFARALILPDIIKDVEEGLYDAGEEGGEGKPLPYGYTHPRFKGNKAKSDITKHLDRIERVIKANPHVQKALDRRAKFVRSLTEMLVKEGLLPEKVLDDSRYYHRQVMKHFNAREVQYVGTGSADVRVRSKGFMKRRAGGSDFNSEYQESELEWASQAMATLARKATLGRLDVIANIKGDLKPRARRQNYINLVGGMKNYERILALRGEIAELRQEVKGGARDLAEVLDARQAELAQLDPLIPFVREIAKAKSLLTSMAARGSLPSGPYADVVDYLAEIVTDRDSDSISLTPEPEGDRFFSYLKWLIENGDAEAKKDYESMFGVPLTEEDAGKGISPKVAALAFVKRVNEKNRFIKDSLGERFETWEDHIPEDYVAWQPEQGSQMFRALTIEERIADRILEGEIKLEPEHLHPLLAVGGLKPQWVIPEGLAKTLDEFHKYTDEPVDNLFRYLHSTWKQAILLGPFRASKYNLNNMSGDTDIVMAFDPRIMKLFNQAAEDLWRYQISSKPNKESVAEEIEDAMNRGVVDSGLTISDIPEISRTGAFKALVNTDSSKNENLIEKYWNNVRAFTVWRENILRLAAYRHFKKAVADGYKGVGVSRVDEIAPLKGDRRAAKLARDLVGDYGAVSKGGMWLRENLFSFWSWAEINMPRYVRLFKNLQYEDGKDPWAAGTRVAAVAGKKIGTKVLVGAGRRIIQAHILALIVTAHNWTFFRDEEEEFRRTRRGLHLMLGRDPDTGEIRAIRVEGALSDALKWIGLDDYPNDIADVLAGRSDWTDKLAEAPKATVDRLINSTQPFIKTPFELIGGFSTYPSIFGEGKKGFRPRKIRDRVEHTLRTFGGWVGLDRLYNHITGKPRRDTNLTGWGRAARAIEPLLVYRTNPDEGAYWTIRMESAKWAEENLGKDESVGMFRSKRSDALYYYRKALAFGDEKAADKWFQEYFELGGTEAGMKQSIGRAHPLQAIPKKDREKYIGSLSGADKKLLDQAIRFYERWSKQHAKELPARMIDKQRRER